MYQWNWQCLSKHMWYISRNWCWKNISYSFHFNFILILMLEIQDSKKNSGRWLQALLPSAVAVARDVVEASGDNIATPCPPARVCAAVDPSSSRTSCASFNVYLLTCFNSFESFRRIVYLLTSFNLNNFKTFESWNRVEDVERSWTRFYLVKDGRSWNRLKWFQRLSTYFTLIETLKDVEILALEIHWNGWKNFIAVETISTNATHKQTLKSWQLKNFCLLGHDLHFNVFQAASKLC